MKKSTFILAVALTLCVGLVAFFPETQHVLTAFVPQDFAGGMLQASVPLVLLRSQHEQKKRDADAKIALIVDGMPDDQARAIETEHEALLRDIEQLETQISEREAEEARMLPGSSLTAAQAADIMDIGTRAGMTNDDILNAVRSNVSVETFRSQAFNHLADVSRQAPTEPGRVLRDERETRRAGMVEALSIRLGAPVAQAGPTAAAREYMDMVDIVEFAARSLDHRSRLVTVRDREELLSRAFHTTSDFPAIFSDAINVSLERRYALAEQSYRRISRRRDFVDFRPHTAVGIGEFPMLKGLTEAGEIKFGTFGESKEQIAVVPYARGIRVTRQMLVNDRLGAIAEIMAGYGRTVSRFEEITFFSMMLSANTKLADGKAVFHADHSNLASAGSAINTTAISTGKAAMRKQKGLDDAKLNITPSILLVSPDKEDEALQYLAPIMANDSVKVNVHVGTLSPVVSAELEGNPWYLFADPADAAVYQWGFLDGYTAPRVRFDEPFGTQGIGMTVEHDFGCGAIDFRGGFKNPGA
ncbi:Mu-like prophage major head subunit gpT family protein [Mesorhizobium sp. CAU 1732]|uniref:phage major capsid protein n=1 Tax=Mesorhizobium sp. CAU 1732 TaxID=3140358 RepID=UPI003261132B